MIDLMILFVLLKRDLTMYAIKKHIADKFAPFTNPSFGALKPALVRLEKSKAVTSSKIMSDGGKLSAFYSITDDGIKTLKNLLLEPFSKNPIQFVSDAKVKLCCASFLSSQDLKQLLENIKAGAYLHRMNAQKILEDEYNPTDFYQKIVLDNTICEYNNFISMIEGFEKENGRNS
jgi:DNA-binding PadR family transcriptional regulator